MRPEFIVSVQKGDKSARRRPNARIPGGGDSLVRLLQHSHAWLRGERAQRIDRAVNRAVINDNNLVWRFALFKATPDCATDVLCAIIRWDDDRNGRPFLIMK
jgi:hypothetical protein